MTRLHEILNKKMQNPAFRAAFEACEQEFQAAQGSSVELTQPQHEKRTKVYVREASHEMART